MFRCARPRLDTGGDGIAVRCGVRARVGIYRARPRLGTGEDGAAVRCGVRAKFSEFCARSSVGQSTPLITGGSQVQVLPGADFFKGGWFNGFEESKRETAKMSRAQDSAHRRLLLGLGAARYS